MGKKKNSFERENKNSVGNWQKQVVEYDLNGISDKRTFDILLMVESEQELSASIAVFDDVVKDNPICSFKSITFKNILQDVLASPLRTDDATVSLYSIALTEARSSIKTVGCISEGLLAKLLKFKIIITLQEDVALIDSEENRHLYVILSGFYETRLLKKLWEIGISLSAIVEVLHDPKRHSIESKEDVKSLHHVLKTSKLPILAGTLETDYVKPDICHSHRDYPYFKSFIKNQDGLSSLFSADFFIKPKMPEEDYATDNRIINEGSTGSCQQISKTIDALLDNIDRNARQVNSHHFRTLVSGIHRVANFLKTKYNVGGKFGNSSVFDITKSTILVRPNVFFNAHAKKEVGLRARFDKESNSELSQNKGDNYVATEYDLSKFSKATCLSDIYDSDTLEANQNPRARPFSAGSGGPNPKIKQKPVHSAKGFPHIPILEFNNSSSRCSSKSTSRSNRSGKSVEKKKSEQNPGENRLRSALSTQENKNAPTGIIVSKPCNFELPSEVNVNERNKKKCKASFTSENSYIIGTNLWSRSNSSNSTPRSPFTRSLSILTAASLIADDPPIYDLNEIPRNKELRKLGDFTNDNLGLVRKNIPLPTMNDSMSDENFQSAADQPLFKYFEKIYLQKLRRSSQRLPLPREDERYTHLDLKNFHVPRNIHLLRMLTGTMSSRNSIIRELLEKKFSSTTPDDAVRYLLTTIPFNSLFENSSSRTTLSPCTSHRNLSPSSSPKASPDRTTSNLFSCTNLNAFDYTVNDSNLYGYNSSVDNVNNYNGSAMRLDMSVLSNFESNGGTFRSDSQTLSNSFSDEESSDETFTEGLDYCQAFWKSFMKIEPKAKYLSNTPHMRIFPIRKLLFNRSKMSDEEIIDSFFDIKTITTMRKRYNDYINNTTVINVTQRAKKLPISAFKTYNALSDKIPPECFSVGLILDLVVSEVVARVSKKEEAKTLFENQQNASTNRTSDSSQKGKQNKTLGNRRNSASKNNNFNSKKGEAKQSIEIRKRSLGSGSYEKRKPSSGTVKSGKSLLSMEEDGSNFIDVQITPFKSSNPGLKVKKNKCKEWAKHLIKALRTINPNYIPSIGDVDNCIKKFFINMKPSCYFLNNANVIRRKLSPYPDLLKPLSDIHLKMLKKSMPVLLMEKFKVNNMDVLLGCYQLYLWHEKENNVSFDHFILKVLKIQFDNMRCEYHIEDLEDTKSKLELMFPKEICPEVCDFVETDNAIDSLSISNEIFLFRSCILGLTIPTLFYSPKPCLHEAKNVDTYLWYENLDAADFLQCISEAEKKFLCLDHKFTIYGSALLLRYHNRVNNFGINTKLWNVGLPTKVTFDQFCKYTVHEKKMPKYIYKLRNNSLVQSIGYTHSFHSVDGFSVNVDKPSFVGHSDWLTISLCSESNYLFFHWDKKKSFRFHFSFQNGVVLTFQKPTKSAVRIKVAEMIRRKKDRFRRKPIYTTLLKPIDEEDKVRPYKEEYDTDASGCRISRIHRMLSELGANEVAKIEKRHLKPDDARKTKVSSPSGDARKTKVSPPRHSYSKNVTNERVERAQKLQNASFRVCSTALHKFAYFAKRKSYVNLECGKKMIRLLAKHPKYKLQRKLRTLKFHDINPEIEAGNKVLFNIKFSLPNGLFVSSVPGYDNFPCSFKQGFTVKGPQCKAIRHEISRTFLNSGKIIIKGDDGIFKILSRDGSIAKCEVPGNKIFLTKYTGKKSPNFNEDSKLEELVKKSQSMVRKKLSHIIAKPESRHCRLFRKWRNVEEVTKFSKGKAKRFDPLRQHKNELFYFEYFKLPMYIYHANKATAYLLSECGSLVTEFKDGTRITSSFHSEEVWWYKELTVVDTWILVDIIYTFEHPNYLTITYSSSNVKVSLPNNTNLVVNKLGEVTLTYSKSEFEITNKMITFRKLCSNCNQSSNGIFDISSLYKEVVKKKSFQLFYIHDTYDKAFRVSSTGKCFKNASEGDKHEFNKYDCNHHLQQDHQELFVMNRDYSGMRFIDAKGLTRTIEDRFNVATTKISTVSTKAFEVNPSNYDAISILTKEKSHYSSYMSQYNVPKISKKKRIKNSKITTYINQMSQFKNVELVREINEVVMEKTPRYMEEIMEFYKIPQYDAIENEKVLDAQIKKWRKWHKKYDTNCTCELHSQQQSPRTLATLTDRMSIDTIDGMKSYKSVAPCQIRSKPLTENSFPNLDDKTQELSEIVNIRKKEMLDTVTRDKQEYVSLSYTSNVIPVECNLNDSLVNMDTSLIESQILEKLNLIEKLWMDESSQSKLSLRSEKYQQTQPDTGSESTLTPKSESKLTRKQKQKPSKRESECKCNPFIEIVKESKRKLKTNQLQKLKKK